MIGTTEIVIILAIALLVFGPQKLPEIGRQIGSAVRELRRMTGDVQRALDLDDYLSPTPPRYSSTYETQNAAISAPTYPYEPTAYTSPEGGDYYHEGDTPAVPVEATPPVVGKAKVYEYHGGDNSETTAPAVDKDKE